MMLFPLNSLFFLAPLLQLSLLLILAQTSVFRRRSMQLFYCSAVPLLLALLALLVAVLGIVSSPRHNRPAQVIHVLLDFLLGVAILQVQFLLFPSLRWRRVVLIPILFSMSATILAFVPGQHLPASVTNLAFLLLTFPSTLFFLLGRAPSGSSAWSSRYTTATLPVRSYQVQLSDLSPSPTSSSFSRPSYDKQEKRSLSYEVPAFPINAFCLPPPPPPPPTPTSEIFAARPRSNTQRSRDPTISWFSAHSDIDLETGVARGNGDGVLVRLCNSILAKIKTFCRMVAMSQRAVNQRRPVPYLIYVRTSLALFVGQVLLSASTTMRLSCVVLLNSSYQSDFNVAAFTRTFSPVLSLPRNVPYSSTTEAWTVHTLAVLKVIQVVFTILAILCILFAYFSLALDRLRRPQRRPLSIQVTTTRTTSGPPASVIDTLGTATTPSSPPPAYSSPGRRSNEYYEPPPTPTPAHTYIRPPQRTRNHRSCTIPPPTPTPAPRPVKVELPNDGLITPSPYSRFLNGASILTEGPHARLSPTPERRATIVHIPHRRSHEPIVACEVERARSVPASEPVKKKSSLISLRSRRKSARESLVERSRKASFASFCEALQATQRDSKAQIPTLQPSTMFHSPSCFSRMSLHSRASRLSRFSKIASGCHNSSSQPGPGTEDHLQELFDPSDPFAMTPLPQLRQASSKGSTSAVDLYTSALGEKGSASSCESYETARTTVRPPPKALQQGRKRGMHAWGRLPLLYSSSSKESNKSGRAETKDRQKDGKRKKKDDDQVETMEDNARLAANLLIRMGEPGAELPEFRAV